MVKNFEDIIIRFGATPEHDRQTDRHRVTAKTALMHMHRAVKTRSCRKLKTDFTVARHISRPVLRSEGQISRSREYITVTKCVITNRQEYDFYRASAHWRSILIYQFCPSVCLSVYPFVFQFPVSDENSLTYCHSFFSSYGSSIILVLSASNIFTKFRRGPPCDGATYRWGIKISRFSTNKLLYIADDTR